MDVAGPRAQAQAVALRLYYVATILSIAGILGLVAYSVKLGSLLGTGVEDSFGFALAIMFLLGALLAHLVDTVYREYPFGRRVVPSPPPPVTNRSVATFLTVLVLVAFGGAIAYVLATLIM